MVPARAQRQAGSWPASPLARNQRPRRRLPAEYCARGSLTHVLMAARRDASVAKKLTWTRRLSMLLDAALGML